MPCYHPIPAWQLLNVKTDKGKPTISFKNPFAKPSKNRVGIQVPCGRCIGCALERSRQWAVRCVHESQLHEDNCFLTLTYSPIRLPANGSLVKRDFQLFMKRLRKFICDYIFVPKQKKYMKRHNVMRLSNAGIKFFQCGEYGSEGGRPHYHVIVFGFDFLDKIFLRKKDGVDLFESPSLKRLWRNGFSSCGSVTEQSCAYVARYTLKKICAVDDVPEIDVENWDGRIAEYVTMSRGGRDGRGIAYDWYKKYNADVFPCDNVVVHGKIGKPPKYYDKQLEAECAAAYEKIKVDRKAKAVNNSADNTRERLAVKEKIKLAQIGQLKRGYENA